VNSKYLLIFSVVTGIAVLQCTQKDTSPVIAKVGNEILTLDELKRNMPVEYRDQFSKEQNINYVKQWRDTELLFQEAVRNKIDKEPEIKKRLQKNAKGFTGC